MLELQCTDTDERDKWLQVRSDGTRHSHAVLVVLLGCRV